MKDFYSIEENFVHLFNDIAVLLSGDIVDNKISENWLVNWYVCNKYNTTKAIELYAADLVIPKLKSSQIPEDQFKSIIDMKINGCFESYNDADITLEDKLYMIESIQQNIFNINTFSYFIQDLECIDVVEYINESFFNNSIKKIQFNILDESCKEILNILSHIKHAVIENYSVDHGKLKYIKACNNWLLNTLNGNITEGVFHREASVAYKELVNLLENQEANVKEYVVNEIKHVSKLIDYVVWNKITESDTFVYSKAVDKFNQLVEGIFFDESDDDYNIEELLELYKITEAICDYESTLEASSRIITKGTNKITHSIGDKSAKMKGMSASDSKIGQIKRGAKIIDDRASDAINNKIDQITNFARDAKREKIITGRTTFKLSRALKTIIGWIIAGKVIGKSPIMGLATTIIGILTTRALKKHTEEREKKRILLELETELRITKEKIEDAKGDNAKEQKYQLMRIEANLEKEILRIKHGMKYY